MIHLGTVLPGSTVRIPFSSFDKDDGSSVTMTNFAAADILVYKDGGTTERASTSGFTATTDFDSKTGKHLIVLDLSDNTTADFWAAGSDYQVAVDSVTIDAVTTGGWVGAFRIGYPGAILDTTIATLASQTSFTLTSGPADDDALNGMWAVIHDAASAVQKSWVLIDDYTGSSKTVTLAAGATFTVAAKDNISVMFPAPLQPTTIGRKLDVTTTGAAGVDWGNVENPTTTVNLSGTTVKAVTDAVSANVTQISGDSTAADNLEAILDGTGGVTLVASAFTLTTPITANCTQLSGDATAADNAESFFDGTGYAGTGNVIPTVTTVTNAVTAGTVSDKTGYSLASGGLAAVSAWTVDITGSLSGSVGSVTGAVGSVTGAVGSVTGNVGGNVTGSVGSVASGGITAASIATGAIDADAIAADAATEIADAILSRDVDQVEATAPVDSLTYVVLASRYSARSGTTLTVYRTDGSTPFSTRTLSTTTTATYIIGINT